MRTEIACLYQNASAVRYTNLRLSPMSEIPASWVRHDDTYVHDGVSARSDWSNDVGGSTEENNNYNAQGQSESPETTEFQKYCSAHKRKANKFVECSDRGARYDH